jgi:sulfur relay (sulfurtransferase) complex TusBCD TusD component (DsrE family)
MLVTFPAYGRSASCMFKCLACAKDKRKRTFRVEMTVNPYNVNPDGTQKTATEVMREAQAAANLERDQFMNYPLCKGCEDARGWSEMKAIRARRQSSALPKTERP